MKPRIDSGWLTTVSIAILFSVFVTSVFWDGKVKTLERENYSILSSRDQLCYSIGWNIANKLNTHLENGGMLAAKDSLVIVAMPDSLTIMVENRRWLWPDRK